MQFKILIICSKNKLYKAYGEALIIKFDNESIYLNIKKKLSKVDSSENKIC